MKMQAYMIKEETLILCLKTKFKFKIMIKDKFMINILLMKNKNMASMEQLKLLV